MTTFLNVLFLVIGLVLLIKGADFFVSSASAIAKKLKIPSLIIGLTIVAIGTSLPELAVSVSSAIKGVTDMSIGNIVGSNMFNTFICLGVVALFSPIVLQKSTQKQDFPFLILLTSLLVLFAVDKYFNRANENVLSRTESLVLLGILVFYMVKTILDTRKMQKEVGAYETKPKEEKPMKVWKVIILLVSGLAGVIFGGECVTSTSQYLAIKMGMSEALVGITIVAIGTSLPELVTSIMAVKKGENELAVGNVVGSNIMNIALILGTVGAITQISISFSMLVDLIILLVATTIFMLMTLKREKINRTQGIILICIYICYMAFAIVRNYCF